MKGGARNRERGKECKEGQGMDREARERKRGKEWREEPSILYLSPSDSFSSLSLSFSLLFLSARGAPLSSGRALLRAARVDQRLSS